MTYKEEDKMKRATLNHTYNVKKAKGSEHLFQLRKYIDRLRSERILILKKRQKKRKKKRKRTENKEERVF